MSIGRINCATNAGSPKLTTIPSSTFAAVTSRLKNPLQPPFKDEMVVRKVVAASQNPERERTTVLRKSVVDVAPNVNIELLQEIAELRQQGIKVDDENDLAPENAQPSGPATQTIGQWVTPTIFPRRLYSWPEISDMTELSLFSMAFPEKWARDVLIPATKRRN